MFKKLILLVSIIAVVATACNKEDSPMPDNTVVIESQENSINLRGDGLGPALGPSISEDDLPVPTISESYYDLNDTTHLIISDTIPFIIVPDLCVDDTLQTFTLWANSDYQYSGLNVTSILWELNSSQTIEGESVLIDLPTSSPNVPNIKCTVSHELNSTPEVFELEFFAWFNNILQISSAGTVKDKCDNNVGGNYPGVISLIIP